MIQAVREPVDQAEHRNQYHSDADYIETYSVPTDNQFWLCSHWPMAKVRRSVAHRGGLGAPLREPLFLAQS